MKVVGTFAALTLGATLLLGADVGFPPADLTGIWEGQCKAYLQKVDESGQADTAWIEVKITIGNDGKVEGLIGDALLKGAQIRRNRGWLGRKLKMKTDYIIDNGTLEGTLTCQDHPFAYKIKLPFNIKEGEFRGRLFIVPSWWKSLPILPHLKLNKSTCPQTLLHHEP